MRWGIGKGNLPLEGLAPTQDANFKRQPLISEENAPHSRRIYRSYNETPTTRRNPKMTKTQIAKIAVGAIVGSGTTTIVSSIIKNNTQPENVKDQITIAAGGVVIGMMAAQATRKYSDEMIDDITKWWTELRSSKKTA